MLPISIPQFGEFEFEHLVLDYNGTLAVDGTLIDGVASRLNMLADSLEIHVVTADTFGRARENLADVRCSLAILPPGAQDTAKMETVAALGAERTITIGNGRNDALMLKAAGLGIAVLQKEGASVVTLLTADVVVSSILDALDLLTNPLRLKATLRA